MGILFEFPFSGSVLLKLDIILILYAPVSKLYVTGHCYFFLYIMT